MEESYLSVMVGDHTWALRRPYNPTSSLDEIRAINQRAENERSLKFATGHDAIKHIQSLEEYVKNLEVFGAWAGGCVLGTIVDSLKKGIKVRVPKGFTLTPDSGEKYDVRENVVSYNQELEGPELAIEEDKEFLYFTPKDNS